MSKKADTATFRTASLLLAALLALAGLAACQSQTAAPGAASTAATTQAPAGTTGGTTATAAAGSVNANGATAVSLLAVSYKESDLDIRWSSDTSTTIDLQDDSAAISGGGASFAESTLTITAAGTYILSGELADGQILVNSPKDSLVRLVLNGVSVHGSDNPPLFVQQAGKVVLILASASTNKFSDSADYVVNDQEAKKPDAVIYSTSDLTITGSGTLTVEANFQDGITSKDKLKIISGDITVRAVGDGLKGRDCIAVKDGVLMVEAGSDGLESSNSDDPDKGFVLVEGGDLTIIAAGDGIQAATSIQICGGQIGITTRGGSENGQTEDNTDSAKGLHASADILVSGGTLTVDSADDALNADRNLQVSGGTLTLASGDDGMHADTRLVISGGQVSISKSYEGIESAIIIISGGQTFVVSSDDGVNVSGGADGSSIGGRPGQNNFASSGNDYLNISGGSLTVTAGGDGLDINGPISMSGGTVLISGPTSNNNSAIDYTGSFQISGGILLAAGSSGMAQMPDNSSTQCAVMVSLDQTRSGGQAIEISGSDGRPILSFTPEKTYQNVVFSSPELKQGSTYTLSCGGAAAETIQISGIITMIGAQPRGPFMPGGRPGGRR